MIQAMAACFEDDALVPPPAPSGPSSSPKLLASAERDLDWLFSTSASALGLHGSGFEPGSPVWDQERVDTALCKHLEHARVKAVRKHYRVSHVLAAMPIELQRVASELYAPRVFSTALQGAFAAPPFDPRARGDGDQGNVVGIVPRTIAFRGAYAGPDAARLGPYEWMGFQATKASRPKWVSAAKVEAIAMRRSVVVAFVDAARVTR
jgi:hypothetical protein